MKTLLSLPLWFALALVSLQGADDKVIAAVRAADDERAAAMIAGDRARLTAIFSDDLRYAHSSGTVDTKATFTDSLASGRQKYTAISYDERVFNAIAPGIVLMTGRGHFKVASGATANDLHLGFLAVWREEKGRWRFVAWQSCRILAPATPAK
ncbi:MAG: hypothetical protein RIQ93_233 [Verrucomicrobiota bacterium]|jgi:hypothetical protein